MIGKLSKHPQVQDINHRLTCLFRPSTVDLDSLYEACFDSSSTKVPTGYLKYFQRWVITILAFKEK
jgi:hypothetical protein